VKCTDIKQLQSWVQNVDYKLREKSWPYIKVLSGIPLEGLRKTMKNLCQIIVASQPVFELDITQIQRRSITPASQLLQ
jgi:hypothetical protein